VSIKPDVCSESIQVAELFIIFTQSSVFGFKNFSIFQLRFLSIANRFFCIVGFSLLSLFPALSISVAFGDAIDAARARSCLVCVFRTFRLLDYSAVETQLLCLRTVLLYVLRMPLYRLYLGWFRHAETERVSTTFCFLQKQLQLRLREPASEKCDGASNGFLHASAFVVLGGAGLYQQKT